MSFQGLSVATNGTKQHGFEIFKYIEFKIFKTFFAQSFKNVKNTYFGPKENRPFFSNFALCSKCRHVSITRFDILIFYNKASTF